MKNFLYKYRHIWVFVYFIFYCPWYFGLQYIQHSFTDVYTVIDQSLPFIQIFVYPYVYWFLFVAGTILYMFLKHRRDFYKCIAFLFIGMTICLIIFTIFPTSFDHRGVVVGNSLSAYLVRFIYMADKCQNVFPSIHVFNSIGCAIALIHCVDFKNSYGMKIFAIVSAILIILSTMFIKQHSILDALSASVLSILLYWFIYKKDILKIDQRVDDQIKDL